MSGDQELCLLASSAGRVVTVWDPSTQQSKWSVTSQSLVHCVRWNHTNQVVGSAGEDGLISLYHHSSGHSVGCIPETADATTHEPQVHSIAFSKGSRYLATGGEGQEVNIWDLKRKVKVKSLLGHTEAVRAVTYSSGDQHIASGGDSGVILLHAQLSGTCIGELRTQTPCGAIQSLQYCSHPTARHLLAAACTTGSVFVWDSGVRGLGAQFVGAHKSAATAVAFSASSPSSVFSGGLDRWLHWFDLSTSRACQSLQLESPITSLAVKGDGVTLAAGTAMGKTFLYDLRRAGPLTPLVALGQHTLHAVTSLHWQAYASMLPQTLADQSARPPSRLVSQSLPNNNVSSPNKARMEGPLSAADLAMAPPLPLTPVGSAPGTSSPITPGALSMPPGTPSPPGTSNHMTPGTSSWLAGSAVGAYERALRDKAALASPNPMYKSPNPIPTYPQTSFARVPSDPANPGGVDPRPGGVDIAAERSAQHAPSVPACARSTQATTTQPTSNAVPPRQVTPRQTASTAAPPPPVETRGGQLTPRSSYERPPGGGGASGGAPGGGAHVPQFMVQMFQRALDESLAALKTSMHSEMQNLHMEMLRQFTLQQQDMSELMEEVSARQTHILEGIAELKRLHHQTYHHLT